MTKTTTVLIMSIGMNTDGGGDLVDALMLDIKAVQPKFLGLICSKQSRANAERVLELSELEPGQSEILELVNPNDLDEIFRGTNEMIERIVQGGFACNSIAIDYTSGTKVMGAGLVLAAVYNRIHELRYIRALGMGGKGKPDTNRILTTQPAAVFAYQELVRGRQMLFDMHFRTAHCTFEAIDQETLSEDDRGLLNSLNKLSHAYEVWDNLNPVLFLEYYGEVDFGDPGLAPFQLSSDQMQAIHELAAEMQEQRIGPYAIVDLFNNANRRVMLGRPTDAITRIYRALEMLAQWVLMRDHDIDTNNVETRKIPPRDRVAFEAMRSLEDGEVHIGLRKAYDLLAILGSPLGEKFTQSEIIRDFMHKRSRSILAHGISPDDSAIIENSLHHFRNLFLMEIRDFDERVEKLNFPWLVGVTKTGC